MTFNRIKIFVSLLIISFVSLISTGASAGEDGSPFEGTYIGFLASKSTFSATGVQLARNNVNIPSAFGQVTSATSKDSYGGGLFAGYGLSFGMLYTSAEAGFVIDKGNTIFSDGTNTIKISQSNTFELNVRGGFHVSDKALVYGLVGYSGSNIKSDGINGRQRGQSGLNYNKRLTSLRYGGGIEIAAFENIAIRAEYTRSSIGDALYLEGSNQFTFKPKTSRIMLSVVLHMY